ncbi:FAD-dependent oxidoreductase, partial [Streptomyces sp. NPDC051132]
MADPVLRLTRRAGLSAAHELAERGYTVTVYEYYDVLGGKA